ncbi:MAG: DUF503 domain-containing protein [Roseiflexaceae bacterium]
MIVGSCRITLYLPGVHSLKEKRSIVKSVLMRLRNEFNVATAEVDAQDNHQRAVLGVVCVSASGDYAEGLLDAVIRWIEEHRPDAPVIDYDIELL